MKRYKNTGMWEGIVNGETQIINVVGTYGGNNPFPIVRVEEGKDKGKALAIEWETGEIIKELHLS